MQLIPKKSVTKLGCNYSDFNPDLHFVKDEDCRATRRGELLALRTTEKKDKFVTFIEKERSASNHFFIRMIL